MTERLQVFEFEFAMLDPGRDLDGETFVIRGTNAVNADAKAKAKVAALASRIAVRLVETRATGCWTSGPAKVRARTDDGRKRSA